SSRKGSCNELQRNAPDGDEPVRTSVRARVAITVVIVELRLGRGKIAALRSMQREKPAWSSAGTTTGSHRRLPGSSLSPPPAARPSAERLHELDGGLDLVDRLAAGRAVPARLERRAADSVRQRFGASAATAPVGEQAESAG